MKVLRFLRITDENDLLSLTNISVILMLVKIGITPALSMQDIALAMIPMLNYSYKRSKKGSK